MPKKSVTPAEQAEQTQESTQEAAQETLQGQESSEAEAAGNTSQEGQETGSNLSDEEEGTAEQQEAQETGRDQASFDDDEDGEDEEEDPEAEEPVTRLAVVDSLCGLNLREGPGKEHEILAVLPGQTIVELLELFGGSSVELFEMEIPGWTLVHTQNRVGWVNRQFLVNLENP